MSRLALIVALVRTPATRWRVLLAGVLFVVGFAAVEFGLWSAGWRLGLGLHLGAGLIWAASSVRLLSGTNEDSRPSQR